MPVSLEALKEYRDGLIKQLGEPESSARGQHSPEGQGGDNE